MLPFQSRAADLRQRIPILELTPYYANQTSVQAQSRLFKYAITTCFVLKAESSRLANTSSLVETDPDGILVNLLHLLECTSQTVIRTVECYKELTDWPDQRDWQVINSLENILKYTSSSIKIHQDSTMTCTQCGSRYHIDSEPMKSIVQWSMEVYLVLSQPTVSGKSSNFNMACQLVSELMTHDLHHPDKSQMANEIWQKLRMRGFNPDRAVVMQYLQEVRNEQAWRQQVNNLCQRNQILTRSLTTVKNQLHDESQKTLTLIRQIEAMEKQHKEERKTLQSERDAANKYNQLANECRKLHKGKSPKKIPLQLFPCSICEKTDKPFLRLVCGHLLCIECNGKVQFCPFCRSPELDGVPVFLT